MTSFSAGNPALGVLHGGGLALTLRESDALTAARMLVGEEGFSVTYEGGRAVLSSMLRRWFVINAAKRAAGDSPLWPTLHDLLVAYSVVFHPTQDSQVGDRRARIQNLAWASIPETAQRVARDLLSGRAPLSQIGSGAIHFASPKTVASKLPRNPGWQKVASPARNQLVSNRQGRAGGDPVVRGTFPGGGAGLWWLVFVTTGGAAVAYFLGR